MTNGKTTPDSGALRGALSPCCGMWRPIALDEENSRSGANQRVIAPVAARKEPRAEVHYRTPLKGWEKCGLCLHLITDSTTCKQVDGQISPNGGCILWTSKA